MNTQHTKSLIIRPSLLVIHCIRRLMTLRVSKFRGGLRLSAFAFWYIICVSISCSKPHANVSRVTNKRENHFSSIKRPGVGSFQFIFQFWQISISIRLYRIRILASWLQSLRKACQQMHKSRGGSKKRSWRSRSSIKLTIRLLRCQFDAAPPRNLSMRWHLAMSSRLQEENI